MGTVTNASLVSAPVTGYGELSDLPDGRDVTLTSDVSVRMNINSFSVNPTSSNAVIPNHRDPSGRIATAGSNRSRDQYTLAQIGYIGIREICLADGTIPASAFTKRINFMPPSEIHISREGLTNAFDNDFVSFDDGITRFDESGNTRDTEGRYATSFDEDGISFDTTTTKFDVDSNTGTGAFVLFSSLGSSFDNSSETFDAQ